MEWIRWGEGWGGEGGAGRSSYTEDMNIELAKSCSVNVSVYNPFTSLKALWHEMNAV